MHLERRQGKQSVDIQQSEKCLGHTEGRLVAHLQECPRERVFTERDLWGKNELAGTI